MRELHPIPDDDVDPFARYGGDDRSSPRGPRPWVTVNMIATVDGATAIEGRSGGLGGPADRLVFHALRAVADVILVGAGTVRAESYGPPAVTRGRTSPPRLAIVSRSLELEPASRVFTDAHPAARPMIVTTASSDPARRAQLEPVADIITTTGDAVDLVAALDSLRARGARVVVCEGGPSLNGQLIAADAIDELCLSLSPLLVGGRSPRLAHGEAPPIARRMRLDRVIEADDLLFLRYLRGDVSAASGPSTS